MGTIFIDMAGKRRDSWSVCHGRDENDIISERLVLAIDTNDQWPGRSPG